MLPEHIEKANLNKVQSNSSSLQNTMQGSQDEMLLMNSTYHGNLIQSPEHVRQFTLTK